MANQGLQFHFWRDGSHNSNGLENHEELNWQVRTGFLKHFAVPFALMLIGRISCSYSLKTWTLHSRGLRANHEITASLIACAPSFALQDARFSPHPCGKIWDDSGKSLQGVCLALLLEPDPLQTFAIGLFFFPRRVEVSIARACLQVTSLTNNKSTLLWFIYRTWNENIVQEACQLLAGDLPLAPGAPGGQVEYRRSLASSFFFKFYLNVSQQLGHEEVSAQNFII